MTEGREFRSPDFGIIKEKLNNTVIFDGRAIYTDDEMRDYGFNYISIGRKDILQ